MELENEKNNLGGAMSQNLEKLKKSITKKWEITEDINTNYHEQKMQTMGDLLFFDSLEAF
jgi:hypothetical protein